MNRETSVHVLKHTGSHIRLHPTWAFGQHLELVLLRQRHDGEHLVDERVRHPLVEQVTQAN